MISLVCVHHCYFFVISELMDEQRSQSEETVSKLKQLLVRTKKELGESKKREGELQQTIHQLHSNMEAEKQMAESAKVSHPPPPPPTPYEHCRETMVYSVCVCVYLCRWKYLKWPPKFSHYKAK